MTINAQGNTTAQLNRSGHLGRIGEKFQPILTTLEDELKQITETVQSSSTEEGMGATPANLIKLQQALGDRNNMVNSVKGRVDKDDKLAGSILQTIA